MTTDIKNHQAIRGLLEKALQQVSSTQKQVTAIESELQELKSQIDLSLEAIDPVLKQLESGGSQAEKVRHDVSATLCEMFDQVSRIVNTSREQLLNFREDESDTKEINPTAMETEAETLVETLAQTVPEEPTPMESPVPPVESLTGPQVGQRATESLNEMIETIGGTNAEPVLPETKIKSDEKETSKGPGSLDSLSALLAKAEAASSETDSAVGDLTSLDDEEEDVQTVSELLKTTSGSFATQ